MDPLTLFLIGLIFSGVMTAGSGIANGITTAQANEANTAEAQKNRDFQERMANTAHQREAADLAAAGMNPWLTATGNGAASPSGSTANVSGIGDFGLGNMASIAQSLAFMAALNAGNTARGGRSFRMFDNPLQIGYRKQSPYQLTFKGRY